MSYDISVIIPIFNAEGSLERCINSLVNQLNGSQQIILINDGSTDSSAEICLNYSSRFNDIVYLEQDNKGASSARNYGLSMAEGKYITFVDSDDYVTDDYFEKLSSYDNSDFILFGFSKKNNEEIKTENLPQELLGTCDKRKFVSEVLRHRIAGPINKRFKKSIILKNNIAFPLDLQIGEDFIFGLKYMLSCQTFKAYKDYLYIADESSNNSVTRSKKYDFKQFIHIYDYAFNVVKDAEISLEQKNELHQVLDYLYCRTAYASVKHLYNSKQKDITPDDLIDLFWENADWGIKPNSFIHMVVKSCLYYKQVNVIILVAKTAQYISELKKRHHS